MTKLMTIRGTTFSLISVFMKAVLWNKKKSFMLKTHWMCFFFFFFHTFYQMIIHYTEIANIIPYIQTRKDLFSGSRIWNCELMLFMSSIFPKEEHGYAKRIFRNLSSTLYLEKTKKTKLLSEASLSLSFKDALWLKQKTTLLPDSDI